MLQLPAQALSQQLGEKLWALYSKQLDIEFPTAKTNHCWEITSNGWVGFIPLARDLAVSLRPKVSIENLFGMLEVAYRLKQFEFLTGLVNCDTLEGYYDQLASVLAKRVLDRARKGYYRTYLEEREQLPFVCGRVDVVRMVRMPWAVRIRCEYEEHTGDVDENQILAWTLWGISKSGVCSRDTLRTVHHAYRSLAGVASTTPHPAAACVGRFYSRLNEDYQPLHALCRFFLDHQSIPKTTDGDHQVLPFLVEMPSLFELFVAEWLRANLPGEWHLNTQEHVLLHSESGLEFRIDLVLSDAVTRETLCVLDTKYKTPEQIHTSDVSQVVAYADAKHVRKAALIFPAQPPIDRLDVGDVSVSCVSFDLSGDLDKAGRVLIGRIRSLVSKY